jgi:hypothetical protein
VNLIGCCPEIDTWRVACYTGIVCHSRASPTELIIEVSCYCERSSTATCDQWYQVLDLIPFHPAPDAQEAHKMFLYYQGTIISNWQCVFFKYMATFSQDRMLEGQYAVHTMMLRATSTFVSGHIKQIKEEIDSNRVDKFKFVLYGHRSSCPSCKTTIA